MHGGGATLKAAGRTSGRTLEHSSADPLRSTPIHPIPRRCGSTLRYAAVTVPGRLSIVTGEWRKSIVGGPPNLASTIARHSPA
jgi:hypothetical protein